MDIFTFCVFHFIPEKAIDGWSKHRLILKLFLSEISCYFFYVGLVENLTKSSDGFKGVFSLL